jgi:hypothetical protein
MQNKERVRKFVEDEWDDKYAYTSRDIADLLGCDTRIARYYLICIVDRGDLCQIKYRGRTYYIKPHQVEMFKQFRNIGLKIR